MVDLQQAWQRVSQQPRFQNVKIGQMVYQAIVLSLTLTTGLALSNQTVTFPGGAVILGIGAAAQPTAQAATQQYRPGLDAFSLAIEYQSTGRSLIGTSQAIGSSVFGPYGDQFPSKEIVMPLNGTLVYSVTNLTTSTIVATFTHHCLTPLAE